MFSKDILQQKEKTSFFHGFLFPIPIMVAGALLLLGSVYLYYDEKWMGFGAAIIIGSVLLFSTEGIEIDKKNQTYREWTRWFGLKSGKSHSLEMIKSLSVILETDNEKFFPVTDQSPAKTEDYYKVFLMNENHLHKIFVAKSKQKEEAFQYAEVISLWLNLEIKTYSPQRFSRQTR